MKKHSTHLLTSIAIVAIAAVALFGVRSIVAHAQTTGGSLDGWAWSSNIGLLSASSSDSGAGGGPYTVNVDGSGNMTGYMWSSNIGWVKFGGLSGQTVGGMTTTDANVNLSTGAVTGWARACAGMDDQVTPPPDQTVPNNTCTGSSRTDGWDGWIELSGANHATSDASGNSGVTYIPSTGMFTGYAWGSDVVGWISFSGIKMASSSNGYTITSSAGTGGSITPLGSVNVSPHGNQNFVIATQTGYKVDSVTIDGAPTTSVPYNGGTVPFLNVTANHTIDSTFITCPSGGCGQSNTLTVTKAGSGTGTVTGTGDPVSSNNMNCGTNCTETVGMPATVTLTATPSSGSSFTGWSGSTGFSPACSSTGTCTININGAVGVTATFINGGGGGLAISSCTNPDNGQTSVAQNTQVTLTAMVTGGTAPYTYDWLNNGTTIPQLGQGSTGTYSFTTVPGTSYSLGLSVTDSTDQTVPTAASYSCGSFSTSGGSSSSLIPELWPASGPTNTSAPTSVTFSQDSNFVTHTYAPNGTTLVTLSTTQHAGSNVYVGYNYPSGDNCTSFVYGPNNTPLPSYSWHFNPSPSTSILSSLPVGAYQIFYTCVNPSQQSAYVNSNSLMAALHNLFATGPTQPTTMTSNTIEIDVASSTVIEK